VKRWGESGDSPHRALRKAQNAHMLSQPWWEMLVYPALFSVPWVIAIAWIVRRTPGGDGTPPPSMGELARRRLGI
jgi:hypothetical protein